MNPITWFRNRVINEVIDEFIRINKARHAFFTKEQTAIQAEIGKIKARIDALEASIKKSI